MKLKLKIKKSPPAKRWQKTTIGVVSAAAAVAAMYFAPSFLEKESMEPVKMEEVIEREETRHEVLLRGAVRSLDSVLKEEEKAELGPTFLALMHHESKLDPASISKTGAAGYFQLTVETASEMGMDNLYAPDQWFDIGPDGKIRWDAGSTWSDKMGYGARLRRVVEDESVPSLIDERFEAKANASAGTQYLKRMIKQASRYSSESRDVALIMHNLGPTAVTNRYLRRGITTAKGILEGLSTDPVGKEKIKEVRRFYKEVKMLEGLYRQSGIFDLDPIVRAPWADESTGYEYRLITIPNPLD